MASEMVVEGGIKESQEEEYEVTEEYLLNKKVITVEDVLRLKGITKGYLIEPQEDFICPVQFTRFKLRSLNTGETLLELEDNGGERKCTRLARYSFPPEVLRVRGIGSTVEFTVGPEPVDSLRMVERHYFRGRRLTSFDFDLGFCMPLSTNTCESIYHLPDLSDQMINELIRSPFETKSDCFFFINGKLAIHNKAEYSFCREFLDDNESCIRYVE